MVMFNNSRHLCFFSAPCVNELIGNRGTLASPNYPADYDNDFDCTWTLHVRRGSVIVIKVSEFVTEHYDDWLAVSSY